MKIILFIVVLIAVFFLIPDRWVDETFMRYIPIEGDGEVAMDDYESKLLLIELGLSAVIAALLVWGCRVFKR
ncbi:Hypothetical protein AKI40_4010 [Enterobacter sp. FY-07]|uniref:hypothetical protein n=1 Tax=Kosakonia oryzendophytica TaxID=1005665 RepID=UPI000777E1FF|nr:hypothetical protein [Kosakonia oryzendophytica]AMO50387.1 Hypothetical protein AKI40_4010 [Enterobacter sp. FY-07]WBT57354.1 hypothetical protein O9K67_19755 [Kosakonia oryzendophytica]